MRRRQRPKSVLLLKDISMDQCKCILNENVILKLKGLHFNSLSAILCDCESLKSNCWKGQYDECMEGKQVVKKYEF